MSSQAALHPNLKNPFLFADLGKQSVQDVKIQWGDLHSVFESGKVIVIDGYDFSELNFFLDHPGRFYPDWIPPISSNKIQKKVSEDHALWAVCESTQDIENFQQNAPRLEHSWRQFLFELFPRYEWENIYYSYRFNHLLLGSLHLDVPEVTYEGHQFRWFVNLDRRPRILAVGPTLFELAEMYWEEKKLWRYADLPVHEFIGALRAETLDQTVNRERELPRHYLTLDPGALWLSHSSYISHGIVYGKKTACLEGQILPRTLVRPERHFNSMIRALQKNGPIGEKLLEQAALEIKTF